MDQFFIPIRGYPASDSFTYLEHYRVIFDGTTYKSEYFWKTSVILAITASCLKCTYMQQREVKRRYMFHVCFTVIYFLLLYILILKKSPCNSFTSLTLVTLGTYMFRGENYDAQRMEMFVFYVFFFLLPTTSPNSTAYLYYLSFNALMHVKENKNYSCI